MLLMGTFAREFAELYLGEIQCKSLVFKTERFAVQSAHSYDLGLQTSTIKD